MAKFVNKYSISPSDLVPGDRMAVKVVACIGQANDWAAYQGPSDWSDEQVAEQGDKIPESAAMELFYAAHASGRVYRA